ncbi:RNA-guided endonuclease InsQ/TnpB family protein, partial [Streptomyces sp. NPDC003635]
MKATHVKRAFKYRFYPTDGQAAELSRTFGCVRKVYNLALAARTEAWARQERVNYHQTSAMLTAWKKTGELAYLNDVSCVPLQQALRHLQTAFANFFGKRAKYPRFKSRKKSRRSAEYTTSAFRFRDGTLTLAKMAEPLDIVWSRSLPEGVSPSTVTVSQDAAGRWFVSLLCEDPAVQPLSATGAAVGIDVGLEHLLTLSTGEKVSNPRHERRERARLARAQRELARKAKGEGSNRVKARRRVAKVYARISDRRRDHLHQLTTRLVRENQTIVIEDLAVRNMVRNGRLARAISDAAWADLRSLLEYKARWYGREVIAVDRWFPSSRLCSACGA